MEQSLLSLVAMDSVEHDKRQQQRRLLQLPVVCYPCESRLDPQDWIFGQTVDVGISGLRIRFRGSCTVQPGSQLDLLILNSGGWEDVQRDVPACIRAQVSWVEKSQHVFGVEYLE